MKPAAYQEPFTAQSDIKLLSEPGVLPRNINLKAFDPHRKEFTCAHADSRTPKVPANEAHHAQSLFDLGLAQTSPALWPKERNYPAAVGWWQQAADLGHWKAAMMLVQTYRNGAGVNSEKGQYRVDPERPEQVIQRLEALMKQNVPDAFYEMGHAYQSGYGVPPDTSRAWALWELAADMGSARAQVEVAKALNYGEGAQALKSGGAWANKTVAIQLFECAVEQGNGQAAFKLGQHLNLYARAGLALNDDKEAQFARARQILHNGVKWGSEDAAIYLGSAFRNGKPLAFGFIDIERSKRYDTLGDALYNNPDLRFPNLDKVLPLPPAKLPTWDGKKQSLIDAAKAVVPQPTPPKPQALAPAPDALRTPAYLSILNPGDRWGANRAPKQGLWLAEPNFDTSSNVHRGVNQNLAVYWLQFAQPQYFVAGELMQMGVAELDKDTELLEHVRWAYLGDPRKTAEQDKLKQQIDQGNWRVKAGVALAPTDAIAKPPKCKAGHACPETGTWAASLSPDHPAASSFNRWDQQAYVRQGEPMPAPIGVNEVAGIETADVTYTLLQRDTQPHFIGDPTDPLDKEREETRQRMLREYEAQQRKEAEGGDAQA